MFDYQDQEKQMTLGELITALERIENKKKPVYFDFGSFTPKEFISWRGSYDLLCLSYTETNLEITVEQLLKKAKAANGAVMEGYKGGNFYMDITSPIWVSQYANSGHTGLLSVTESRYMVCLDTFFCQYGI